MDEHSPEELRAALEAADALISRIQEVTADHLARKDDLDEARAFYEVVEILETSQEITRVRMALGRDPHRFGEETPAAHHMHTG
jgi:alkylhydroperoxidase family enzyme